MGSHERGFTIIEVILFLAISGLLLVIAMAGVSANLNNTRFNDAVKSTTSFLQGQYDQVMTGRNDRSNNHRCDSDSVVTQGSSSVPGMTNCVVLGRYILLRGSNLTSRYIVGYRETLSDISNDDFEAIQDMNPRVAPASAFESTYLVPWDIGISRVKTPTTSPTSLGLAIVRSPASGNILLFGFPSNEVQPNGLAGLLTANNLTFSNSPNRETTICFDDATSGRQGAIRLALGQGQEVIQTDLGEDAEDCS